MTIKLQDIYGLAKTDIIPAGGNSGQVLSKQSGADQDVGWNDLPSTGPITVFDATVSYKAGDFVLENGELHRAIKDTGPGPFSDSDWTQLSAPVSKPPTGININVKGGILGGNLAYVNIATVSIDPTVAPADDMTETLVLRTSTQLALPGAVAKTIYYVFLCNDGGTIKPIFDTDPGGANLPATVTHKRFISYVLTDAAGIITPFNQKGEIITFLPDGIEVFKQGVGQGDHDVSPFLPDARYRQSFTINTQSKQHCIYLRYVGSNWQYASSQSSAYTIAINAEFFNDDGMVNAQVSGNSGAIYPSKLIIVKLWR